MRKIVVVDYRPEWAEAFQREAARIAKVLGENMVAIHHIGSTSVPGLCAKPIIDIMPVVRDIGAVDECNEGFIALGYTPMGEFGIPGRRYFHKGGDERTHHVHVFAEENKEAIERHLAVPAYLRAHADEARAYGELKKGAGRALSLRPGTAIATARTHMCGRWKRGHLHGIGRKRDEGGNKIWRS